MHFALIAALLLMLSCEKTEIDDQKPLIDLSKTGSFPVNCDTLYFGETFNFGAYFTDNAGLGSYSLEIHQNFDHHSHSTEITECILDSVKEAVNTYHFIEDYSLDPGLKEYQAAQVLALPEGNINGAFDDGDYHFLIRLTDAEGWSVMKGLSIKIMHRS